jgi:hypothetical protein
MGPIPFPTIKLLLFLLLSGTDLLLTMVLLTQGSGVVYEGNPIAAWLLASYGWVGVAVFKGLTVLLAVALSVLVFVLRPRSGHRVLTCACTLVAVVVLYSASLAVAVVPDSWRLTPEAETAITAESLRFDALRQEGDRYREVLVLISDDLFLGRCSLAEGVDRLKKTAKANNPDWLQTLQKCYPGLDERSCLAANIVQNTIVAFLHDSTVGSLACRLEGEFCALYGFELRLSYQGMIDTRDQGTDADPWLWTE